MEEEYDYKEETKKWLKSRNSTGIRVGAEYQAVIPEFAPVPRPTASIPASASTAVPPPMASKEEAKQTVPEKSLPATAAAGNKMVQKSIRREDITIGTEAEPACGRETKSDDVDKDKKKPKLEEEKKGST